MQSSSKSQRNELLRLAITLCLIASLTSALVALVNSVTAPVIAKRSAEKTAQSLKEVMPLSERFEEVETELTSVISSDGKEVSVDGIWQAYVGQDSVGYCVKVSPKGYGGAIETIVGISADGDIIGTKIVSMSETSGIGTKINDEEFLSQFEGKSGSITGVTSSPSKDQIQTVSGATKSSKAFLRGVNAALTAVSQIDGGEN